MLRLYWLVLVEERPFRAALSAFKTRALALVKKNSDRLHQLWNRPKQLITQSLLYFQVFGGRNCLGRGSRQTGNCVPNY